MCDCGDMFIMTLSYLQIVVNKLQRSPKLLKNAKCVFVLQIVVVRKR